MGGVTVEGTDCCVGWAGYRSAGGEQLYYALLVFIGFAEVFPFPPLLLHSLFLLFPLLVVVVVLYCTLF